MDIIFQTVDNALEKIDSFVPSPLPVPYPITKVAEFITSQSIITDYKIKNVNFTDVLLWEAIIIFLIHPLFWNLIGRVEYYTKIFSKICIKPIYGVYLLALWIFFAGLYRDGLFTEVVQKQEKLEIMGKLEFRVAGVIAMIIGSVLVLSTFYQLGITGTYLGDYFGILMNSKVTAFPFSILSDPMYDGSTLIFLGKSIL